MATKRDLKKDIKYLTSELLTQVFLKQDEISKEDESKVIEVTMDTVNMHNEFIIRTCHPDGKANPAIVKAYYKELRVNLLNTASDILERIAKL